MSKLMVGVTNKRHVLEFYAQQDKGTFFHAKRIGYGTTRPHDTLEDYIEAIRKKHDELVAKGELHDFSVIGIHVAVDCCPKKLFLISNEDNEKAG